eukprot:1196072-Prorocentrum_minimum.AAC.7
MKHYQCMANNSRVSKVRSFQFCGVSSSCVLGGIDDDSPAPLELHISLGGSTPHQSPHSESSDDM